MTPAIEIQLDDRAARERIRTSLAESLIVEASAGTGKTTELIARIVAVLARGLTTINRIVAVTFTNKAAGELKLRLRQELDRARGVAADPSERSSIENALEHLEEASIGTIHSFCAQILRERPVEAVVDPAFEELSQEQAARLYERAFRAWMQRKLGAGAPALRRALVRLAWRDSFDGTSPIEQLQYAAWKLIEWRDHPAPWRKVQFNRAAEIDRLVEQVGLIAEAASRCPKGGDNLVKSLRPARVLMTWIERAEAAGARRDYDSLESLLIKLIRDIKKNFQKGSGFFAEGVPREQVVQARQHLLDQLDAFQQAADADLAVALRSEMWDLVVQYDQLKRRAGKLDFVDLLLLARDLVRNKHEVRSYLQDRFSHIFIDEFQDTDPLQAEILLLLAADDPAESDWRKITPKPGKLFVVGDPKQSVYKFRRADVVLYRSIRDNLAQRGAAIVQLTSSFRAVRPIQQCVNAAFLAEMQDDGATGQAAYAPLHGNTGAIPGQPSVIALPASRPYGSTRISRMAIDACLPETIVSFCGWLINKSGWKVRDPEDPSQLVPVTSRHICLLFRRFTNFGKDITRDYVRAFEAREIPHLLVGSKSFHSREEVETLRAALTSIEWPDDELSVFATLKGSLFAVPDNLLLRFHHEIGHLHPFRTLASDLAMEFQPITEALQLLADLHRGRNRRPIADTVNALLEATRAHAGFALRPAGHQVLANVHRIADLARSFEFSGGVSFRGFVEELEAQTEKAESAEAPVLEQGAEGVRLMTVHAAKGLEFPIVILADMTANIAAGDPDRYVNAGEGLCATRLLRCAPWELREHEAEERLRERAEGVRVAYVAATRARDLLVVPSVGDQELEGWLSPLNKAIYPAHDRFRHAAAAEGCPDFGDATVADRPFFANEETSVQPGLHTPKQGTHEVVWWDPRTLDMAAPANLGLRQEQILSGDAGEQESPSLAAYRAWKEQRERKVAAGAAKRFDIFTASEALESPADFSVEVKLETVQKPIGRSAGPRFGTLVHTILRDVALAGGGIKELAKVHGRVLGATEQEVDDASGAVAAALQHPLLERARKSGLCRRELPVFLKLQGNRILEGVIDLAFEENGCWHIVDFKTDAEVGPNRKRYENQLRWYSLALARLNNAAVEAHLLSV
ncbi:MAG TPA: UvrD-helicase domain-containing protein [Bryobacteraceae bacterium]|nr:UvrD-helicase domain-containing protein [Bryobacteraceae bacterium]